MYPHDHSGLLSCRSTTHSSPTTQTGAGEPGSETPAAPSAWGPLPPTCAIPDCSSTIIMSQHSGALVNPSYPSTALYGGRLQCRWEINAPANSFIQILTEYVDLLVSDESTKVEVFDEGGETPIKILTLTGLQERVEPVASSTSKVVVTYAGPAANISGHRGFYLKYVMRPLGSRVRQGRSEVTDSSEAKASKDPSSTTAGLAKGDKSAGDDSVDNGIIAVSVVVPLLALALILVGGYYWYRRRYPVRMIIGRDVSKFTNPKYAQPKREATLVRNDAERFFNQPTDDISYSETVTLEMNPVVARWGLDNRAYQGDEIDNVRSSDDLKHDDDDEEERRFREKKGWLFRRSEDKEVDEKQRSNAQMSGLGSINSETDHLEEKVVDSNAKNSYHNKQSEDGNSVGSDMSELLNEQQLTPRRPRRCMSKNTTPESSSMTDSAASVHSDHKNGEKSQPRPLPIVILSEDAGKDIGDATAQNSNEDQPEENKSSVWKMAEKMAEQPSLEQVIAEVKARSRSLSIGNIKQDLNTRQRSYSVDPSKSARKYSLHDEAVLTAYAKFLEPQQILESPTPSHSSHHSMDSSKLRLNAQSSLSASIVGVDIKVKLSSNASSASGGSSLSIHSVDGSDIEERHRCISLVSTNSNPHLVTDLDNVSQNSDDREESIKTEEETSVKNEGNNGPREEANEVASNLNTESTPEQIPVEITSENPHYFREVEDREDESLNGYDKDEHLANENIVDQSNLFERPSIISDATQEMTHLVIDNLDMGKEEKCDSKVEEHKSFSDTSRLENKSGLQKLADLDTKDIQISLTSSIPDIEKDGESSNIKQEPLQESPSVHEPDTEPAPCDQSDSLKQEDLGEVVTDEPSLLYTDEFSEKDQHDIGGIRLDSRVTDKNNKGDREKELDAQAHEHTRKESSEQAIQDNKPSNDANEEKSTISEHFTQSQTEPESPKVANYELETSGEESSDDSASDTSESDGSGVKASYSFGGDDESEKEQEEKNEESSDDSSSGGSGSEKNHGADQGGDGSDEDGQFEDQGATEAACAHLIDPVENPETSHNLSSEGGPISSSEFESGHSMQATSSMGAASLSVNLPSDLPQRRVKILPLDVNLSEDDDGNSDDEGMKYQLSDDDISDILKSSSDENETGELDIQDSSNKYNQSGSSPTTYTFQQYDSSDDDVDV
ncbi:hypothetical protein EGW08_013480 [Elysia chlorotica]|uniref:CUB domain-containing protein n=1 Tax=Elysia chlorotica TaxID=188477 RepID=A0A433TBE3_ELYCH|nr:hypothetical protein EGW08_013480 [Elysia chlorotica]